MNSKIKGFAFFQRNKLPDGRGIETVATFEELSDIWKPGAMDGIPPFVMNCNCLLVYLFASVVWFLLFGDAKFVVFSNTYFFVPFDDF